MFLIGKILEPTFSNPLFIILVNIVAILSVAVALNKKIRKNMYIVFLFTVSLFTVAVMVTNAEYHYLEDFKSKPEMITFVITWILIFIIILFKGVDSRQKIGAWFFVFIFPTTIAFFASLGVYYILYDVKPLGIFLLLFLLICSTGIITGPGPLKISSSEGTEDEDNTKDIE